MTETATHAVGVVFRRDGGKVKYLLVRPRSGAAEWLLPKGHIEPGESAEQAAVREVREEAGVRARVVAPLAMVSRFEVNGEQINARFFLMRYEAHASATEQREACWLDYRDAVDRMSFKESRDGLIAAERIRRTFED